MTETIPSQLDFPETIHLLKKLIVNRDNAFAEQQPDGQYYCKKEELSNLVLEDHLKGTRTIGVYLINPEKQDVKTIGFDIDGDPRDLGPTKAASNVIHQALLDSGVPQDSILVEFTGLKGFRVTVFLDPPISAAVVRNFALKATGDIKIPDGASLEIFPKQDRVEKGHFGNLVKLFFALHRKSGKRAHLVHPISFDPWPWEALKAIKPWRMPLELRVHDTTVRKEIPKTPLSAEDYPCWKKISVGDIPPGSRHDAGFAYCRHLRDKGLSLEATLSVMESWWGRLAQPPQAAEARPWANIESAVKDAYEQKYAVGCRTVRERWPDLCDPDCSIRKREEACQNFQSGNVKIQIEHGICSTEFNDAPKARLIIKHVRKKWRYQVATIREDGFEPGIEHPSGAAPWEENRVLWKTLTGELEKAGVEKPRESLEEIGKTLSKNGGEALFEEKKTGGEDEAITPGAREKALDILKHGNPIEYVGDTVQLMHKGDYELGQYLWLGTLTPELGSREHVIAVGASGVGKSDLIRKVCRCVPPNKRVKLDSASAKSLYYAVKAGVDISGVVFNIDDVDPDDPEQVSLLKLMATDDPEELRHWTLTDDREFTELVCSRRFVVFASTIESLPGKQGQILRRYEVLNPSEDEKALKDTLDYIKGEVRGGRSEESYPPEFEVARAITDEIKNQELKVAIPFNFDFPQQSFEAKTALKKFAALVWAAAKARFMQRIVIGDTLLAQPEDFDLVVKLWGKRQPLKVDEIAMRVLDNLDDQEPMEKYDPEEKQRYWNPAPRTSTTLSRQLGVPPRTVRDKLGHLYDMGLTDRKQAGGRGNPYAYWWAAGVSEKIGNLVKRDKDIRQFVAPQKMLPSLDPNGLVSSLDDYYDQNQTSMNEREKEKWSEYVGRVSRYASLSLSSVGENERNNQQSKETTPIEQSKQKEITPLPVAEEKRMFKPKEAECGEFSPTQVGEREEGGAKPETGGTEKEGELSQADLMGQLGELYKRIGGADFSVEGFVTMAQANLRGEREERLREAVRQMADRGVVFRAGTPEKIDKDDDVSKTAANAPASESREGEYVGFEFTKPLEQEISYPDPENPEKSITFGPFSGKETKGLPAGLARGLKRDGYGRILP